MPLRRSWGQRRGRLYLGDCRAVLSGWPAGSVDMVVADPPYALSGSGTTCQAGRRAPVSKGDWDRPMKLDQLHSFNLTWLHGVLRVARPGAGVWIFGTHHNLFSVGLALQQLGCRLLNQVTWQKPAPPPNLGCRCFTHSTETVLWAAAPGAKHIFNYQDMKADNGDKQMKDVWTIGRARAAEISHGRHPCQKPEALLDRIIRAASRPDDLVLDPFAGSGTTGVVALRRGRRVALVETDQHWVEVAAARIHEQWGQLSPADPTSEQGSATPIMS